MNDHNLEDLIVEEIQPKKTTGKNILTIFALLIIILFVAIFFMRTLLGISPSSDEEISSTIESNISNIVDDDIIFSKTVSPDNPNKANSNLSDIVNDEPTEPKAPQETNNTESHSIEDVAVSEDINVKEEEPLVKDEEESTEEASIPIIPIPVIKDKEKVEKVEKVISKVAQKTKQASTQIQSHKTVYKRPTQTHKTHKKTHYYIQVGSYRKHPSTEFLSIIRKTGFRYKVTPTDKRGIRQLLIGSYSTRNSADNALKQVRDRINKKAFVVKR